MGAKVIRISAWVSSVCCGLAALLAAPAEAHERPLELRPGTAGFVADAGRFVSRGTDATFLLSRDGAEVSMRGRATPVRLRLVGSNDDAPLDGVDRLPGLLYHAGRGASGRLRGVPSYRRVHRPGVYDGVDVEYYRTERNLEFDFVVAAHADPRQIRIAFEGVSGLALEHDGALALRVEGGTVRLKAPVVYQERGATREPVAARYEVHEGRREATFGLGPYDASRALVIDPVFAIGSASDDRLAGFGSNAAGETYLLGSASSGAGYPATQAFPGALGGVCFLTKLDATGTSPVYSILFEDTDLCGTLVVGANGTAYFTGYENPLVPNLHVTTVVAVDDSGGAPAVRRLPVANYSQFFNRVEALAVDAQENLYLLGSCRTVEPGMPGLVLNGFNVDAVNGWPGSSPVCEPGGDNATVLTKMDSTGSVLYGTFLTTDDFGSAGIPGNYALAVDDSGRAFVLGRNWGQGSLVPTPDAYRSSCTTLLNFGCLDLLTIDTTRTGPASLIYASYLWDVDSQEGLALALGPAGSLTVAADGFSTVFPSTVPTAPYPSLPQSPAANRGLRLARFEVDAAGSPNLLAFGLQYTARPGAMVERVTDLRLLPSGAPVLASLSVDPTETVPWAGSISVFYPSGQLRSSSAAFPVPSNAAAADPQFRIATDANGQLFYATNGLQGPSPAPPAWDLETNRLGSVDPGANTPPLVQVPPNLSTLTADPTGVVLFLTVNGFDAEDGLLTANCDVDTGSYRFPIGTTVVHCTTQDSGGLTATGDFEVTVGLNQVPVPPGDPAPVMPSDLLWGTPVTLSFHGVQAPGGNASLVVGVFPRALPAGLRPVVPGVAYVLSTNATFATVDVCLTQTIKARDLGQVSLQGLSGGTWSNLGASVSFLTPVFDSTAQVRLCADGLTTLGPIAVAEPENPDEVLVTVAGNALTAYNGDGIPATSASLDEPAAAVANADGDLYIADRLHDRVRRVSGGIIETAASLPRPSALALEPGGSILVATGPTCQIVRLTALGGATTVAGTACPTPTPTASGDGVLAVAATLGTIVGLAVDSHGNVFYSEQQGRVRRIAAGADGFVNGDDPAEILSTVAGTGVYGSSGDGGKASSAQLRSPQQLAVDAFDNLFIADSSAFRVRRVDTGADGVVAGPPVPDDGSADDEIISTIAGIGPLDEGPGFASCSSGGNGGPASAASMCHPLSLAFEDDGDLLIGEQFIRRVEANAQGRIVGGADETIETIAGTSYPLYAPNGDGSPLTVNLRPTSLSRDPNGNVYVTDALNQLVRRYGPDHSPAASSIVISDATPVTEGDSGTTDLVFTVTATGLTAGHSVGFDFASSDDSASAGSDYTAASGHVSLSDTSPSATILVPVLGDVDDEPDEQLFVTLSHPTGGGVLTDAVATGTILDDDVANPQVLGVTVTSPNGGERRFTNTALHVRWAFTGQPTSFDVELSRNGGATWTPIPACTQLPAPATTCAFTAGGPATQAARLRVTAHDASQQAQDVSDAHFTLAAGTPQVHVQAPNGSARWLAGSTRTIAWSHNLGASAVVRLELSRDDGASWADIATGAFNTSATAGSFAWLVSGPATTGGRVRVTWVETPAASDTSNNPFEILAPYLRVTAPNAGVVWRAGTTRSIRVNQGVGAGESVLFEVSRDGGATWSPIGSVATTAAVSTVFAWLVTGPPTAHARIRATSAGGALDENDGEFTIASPIEVTYPNDAVSWAAGSVRQVKWTHVLGAGQLFDVAVSGDGGATWSSLGTFAGAATSGTALVTLPQSTTSQALVRVSPAGRPDLADVGDVAFEIAAPFVTVSTPNTAVAWAIGSRHTVRWSHNVGAFEDVIVELSRDAGATWTSLLPAGQAVTNTTDVEGTYSWLVTGPSTTVARMRVAWAKDSAVQDLGDVAFRIR